MTNDALRDMIFVSHADEDNDLTRWLALQLAKEGYGVWCDLTKLLGGENWPQKINQALQTRTQKFIFVLSKHSNRKDNPLGELTTAFNVMKREKIENFIVPLKIGDLGFDQMDFRLVNIQSIIFNENNWIEGLSQLLRLLERDNARKHNSFNPDTVNLWWKNYKSTSNAVNNNPEELFSNRYPIVSYPKFVYAHHITKNLIIKRFIPYPVIPFKQYLLSFAEAETLREHLESLEIRNTEKTDINTLMDGSSNLVEDNKIGQHIIVRLFNQALWKGFRVKGLLSYRLSNNKTCFYFHNNLLPDGRIIYGGQEGLSSQVKLWGKTLSENWHWAIRGWFESTPTWHYNMQYHILVSKNIGDIHPAPKRVYFRWNNSTWKDKLRASMLHLAGVDEKIVLPVGSDQVICIDRNPILFTSLISLIEPKSEIIVGDEE